MRAIHLATLYIVFYLVKDIIAFSILRSLLSPDKPPLRRVRQLGQARGFDDHAVLDFVGLIERHGYPAEEHNVTTEDGYHLVLHRIPGSPLANNTGVKKAVYLQHGLIASSDAWVLMGPGKDLPFLLADAGYDVWLGNLRGNTYSKSHRNLPTTDQRFWEFSYHENGVYDLQSMIDYVLAYTGQEKLFYIGHSMGTTTSYVLLSMRPEYNEKLRLLVSLSPVAFWYNGISPVLKVAFDNVPLVKTLLDMNGIFDIAPQSVKYATMAETYCKDTSAVQPFCAAVIFAFSGNDPGQLNMTLLPYIFSYYPAGTSTQTFYHYHQNYARNQFQAYDYGSTVNNRRKYNQDTPPVYDFDKITAPSALFYGHNDALLLPANAMAVAKRLPNLITVEEIPYELFNHLDFLWARDAKKLLYDRLIELMKDF